MPRFDYRRDFEQVPSKNDAPQNEGKLKIENSSESFTAQVMRKFFERKFLKGLPRAMKLKSRRCVPSKINFSRIVQTYFRRWSGAIGCGSR